MVSADGALQETAETSTRENLELVLKKAVIEISEHVDPSVIDIDAIRGRALHDVEQMQNFFELPREDQLHLLAKMSAERAALAETNIMLNAVIDSLQERIGALEERVNTYIEDQVTGLSVRRYFILEAFPQVMDLLRRAPNTEPKWLSVILVDLDKFKHVNDTYGHDAGDEVLRSVSLAFRSKFKRKHADKLTRYGGDELAGAIVFTSNEEVARLCNELVDDVRSLEFNDYPAIKQTISIGVVTVKVTKDKCGDPLELLKGMTKIADEALYDCKDNGRDQIENMGVVDLQTILEKASTVENFQVEMNPVEGASV